MVAASAVPLPATASIIYTTVFGLDLSPIDIDHNGISDFFFGTIIGGGGGSATIIGGGGGGGGVSPTIIGGGGIGGGVSPTIIGGGDGVSPTIFGGGNGLITSGRYLVANLFSDTIFGTIGIGDGGPATVGGGDTIGFILNTIGGIIGDTATHLATVLGAGFPINASALQTYLGLADVDPFGTHDGFIGVHFDVVTKTPILANGETGPTETVSNGEFGWFQFQGGNTVLAAADTSGAPIAAGAVPEPSSLFLMAMGAVALGALRARNRSK
jgi:hypothetical protein